MDNKQSNCKTNRYHINFFYKWTIDNYLIKIKIQTDKERLIANFEGDPLIQVLNGRYGPFIQVVPEKGKKTFVALEHNV